MMAKTISEFIPQPTVADTSTQNPSATESLETERPEEDVEQTVGLEIPVLLTAQGDQKPEKRKDRGHLHATRHAVLSCYPLEALQSLGEDVKKYRRLERRFRETLKPDGEIGAFLFDRFFSSYLRCLLAARVEASSVARTTTSANPSTVSPSLHERDVPTLILPTGQENTPIQTILPTDLYRELVLIQRYDRHFSREMFRALSLLLVLRDTGEDGFQQCIGQILSVSK